MTIVEQLPAWPVDRSGGRQRTAGLGCPVGEERLSPLRQKHGATDATQEPTRHQQVGDSQPYPAFPYLAATVRTYARRVGSFRNSDGWAQPDRLPYATLPDNLKDMSMVYSPTLRASGNYN